MKIVLADIVWSDGKTEQRQFAMHRDMDPLGGIMKATKGMNPSLSAAIVFDGDWMENRKEVSYDMDA